MIIYLHGFKSSPHSHKASLFKTWLKAHQPKSTLVVPALPFDPEQAINRVADLIESAQTPVSLVGSSLGGFYAARLAEDYGLRAAMINPAFAVRELFTQFLGEQVNPYTGETFLLAARHIEQLQRLDLSAPTHPEHFYLLAQTGDEVVDYSIAANRFARGPCWIEAGGNHDFCGFESLIPEICRFFEGQRPATRSL